MMATAHNLRNVARNLRRNARVRVISGFGCPVAVRGYHVAGWSATKCTLYTQWNLKHFSTSAKLQTNPKILTLRPENMAAVGQEVVDVSGKGTINLLTYDRIRTSERYSLADKCLFPKGTKGVLYFRYVPEGEEASQIRFRLCEDVSRFDAGSDLLQPNREPWNVPLRALRRGGRIHQGLVSLLKAEYEMENIFDDDSCLGNQGIRYVQRSVLTLCPENLVLLKQEVFDISGLRNVFLRILTNESSAASAKASEGLYVDRVLYGEGDLFPPNTKGFFYYEKPPAHRAPFGQLRFRNCSDAASFECGTDLRLPSGEPWKLDLWQIAIGATYLGIERLLIKEGAVDSRVLRDLRNRPIGRSTFLFTLDQPFVFELSRRQVTFQLLVAGYLHPFVMRCISSVDNGPTPYFRGRVMARLELSTLPEHAKYGPTLVLRILEILTPNEPVKRPRHGMVPPRPGSLLLKDGKIWKLSVRSRKSKHLLISFIEESRTQGRA